MKLEFRFDKPQEQIVKERLSPKARLFLANEAARLMDPYVPAQNLILAQNTRVYLEDETGIVHYTSPYAHYQYKGELYVSSTTGSAWASKGEYKVPAGKTLKQSKFRHPLATSEWDKAMLKSRKEDLVKAVQNYVNGGGS